MSKYSERLKKAGEEISKEARKESFDKNIPIVIQEGDKIYKLFPNGDSVILKEAPLDIEIKRKRIKMKQQTPVIDILVAMMIGETIENKYSKEYHHASVILGNKNYSDL